MPKPKPTIEEKQLRFIEMFGSDVLVSEGDGLRCILCDCAVSVEKKYTVLQHMKTAKHQSNASLNDVIFPQQLSEWIDINDKSDSDSEDVKVFIHVLVF